MAKLDSFKHIVANPAHNIANRLSKEREERIQHNTAVVKSLLACIVLCGRQGLSLRGHRDDLTHQDEDGSKGNFLELVHFRASTDPVLAEHLLTAPRNATYTSKTIQNELIAVVGKALREEILDAIRNATYFAILADEVTDCSNLEQLSIAIRFVDPDRKEIREEFLDFVTVDRITGEVLATAILSQLDAWDIDVSKCRGQAYDGASNMSSSRAGVQGRISEIAPLAFYTHCQAHQLNLSIVKACSIPQIRNASQTISDISNFFSSSPKRQHFLEKVIEGCELDVGKKAKLKDVCRTRWVQRVDAFIVFYELYFVIIKTMQAISTRNTEYGEWSWDDKTNTKANGFLGQLTNFQFLVSFYVTMTVLSSLRGVTVKLQKRSTDILRAYEQVSEVQMELELMKVNCEEESIHYSTPSQNLLNQWVFLFLFQE